MGTPENAVHWTDLAKIGMSPAHYQAAVQEELDDTPNMRLGRLVHTIVLGGPPSVVWEGKRQGNAWKEFQEQHRGREIVTATEVLAATRIARAVQSCGVAAPYLVGDTEKPLEWTWLGRKCATRGIDVLGATFLTDLKTTRCAEPRRFNVDARFRGYHAQLAFYREAVRAVHGRDLEHAYIVAVESSSPFCVTTFHLGPKVLLEGDKINRLWMERLLACEAAGAFPGYVQSVQEFELREAAPELIVGGEPFEFDGAA